MVRPPQNNRHRVNLVSYRKRWAQVLIDGQGRAQARMNIDGQAAILDHAYITVDDGGLWPDVTQVDLYGRAVADGAPLHERFEP